MKLASDKMFNALRSVSGRIANPFPGLTRALTMHRIAGDLGWAAVDEFGFEVDIEFMFVSYGIFEGQDRKAMDDRMKQKARGRINKMGGRF